MAVAIVLVVVLAVVGGGVLLVRARASAAADRAGTGANEILQSPPTSFPSDRPLTPPALPPGVEQVTNSDGWDPVAELSRPPDRTEAAASTTETTSPEGSGPTDDDADDEAAAARFRAPGSRSTAPATTEPAAATTPPAPVRSSYPLEPAPVAEPEPGPEVAPAASASPAEATPKPEVEPARATEAEAEPEATGPVTEAAEVPTDEPANTPHAGEPQLTLTLVNGAEPVIDLDAIPVAAEPANEQAWRDLVLQPEPDAVDHVLQALINRARFKQVGVEEVATELVERADLRGEEVSDVLAELVGRADDTAASPTRSSELTLFNDDVPSRPGQLTDFAKLNPADKKRIIIRVLCLLVARSEDQQLPPRATSDSGATSWPLARAVWPVSSTDDESDVGLPSRLAKSG